MSDTSILDDPRISVRKRRVLQEIVNTLRVALAHGGVDREQYAAGCELSSEVAGNLYDLIVELDDDLPIELDD